MPSNVSDIRSLVEGAEEMAESGLDTSTRFPFVRTIHIMFSYTMKKNNKKSVMCLGESGGQRCRIELQLPRN